MISSDTFKGNDKGKHPNKNTKWKLKTMPINKNIDKNLQIYENGS